MKRLLAILLLSLANILYCAERQIAVGASPSRYEKIAAEELVNFLGKITLDKYTIVPEENAAKEGTIFLGQTRFARENNLHTHRCDREELVIKSIKGNLIISGGKPVGTLYGVYELLEQLGVHFLYYDVTILPHRKEFSLGGYDLIKKPTLANRTIYDGIPGWMMRKKTPREYASDYWRWQLRNRANGRQGRDPWRTGEYAGVQGNTSPIVAFAHNFYEYVPPKKYFKEHPEYFSMDENGERFYLPGNGRRPGQLCLTNPDVQRITLDFLREMIQKDRERLSEEDWPLVYDISAMDGTRFFCLCPNCDAIAREEGHSGLLLKAFINPIAETIAREYPGLMIRTFAYSFAEKAPKTVRPAKNVIIFYADLYLRADYFRPITSEFNQEQLALFKGWKDIGARVYLWDYWNMGGPNYFYPPRIETCLDAIIEDIRFFTSQKIEGIMTEYGMDPLKPQMFFALDNYVALQLMYNINQDPEMLINRFMSKYYGDAAPEMREILDRIRAGVKAHPGKQTSMRVQQWHFATPEFLRQIWQLLVQAEDKSSGDYRTRVQTEMITPLWVIINRQNETKKTFPELPTLKTKCRELTLRNLHRDEAKRIAGTSAVPTQFEQLEALLMDTPIPPRFAEKEDEILLFATAHFLSNPRFHCPVVDDPDSPTGKAISYLKVLRLPFRIGVANADLPSAQWESTSLDSAPQDEKYHWYLIPKVPVGSKTWLHGFNGALRIDITGAYRIPAGIEDADFNVYDIWFSLKFTGPSYVKNSQKKDAVSIDYVVLSKPGAFNSTDDKKTFPLLQTE